MEVGNIVIDLEVKKFINSFFQNYLKNDYSDVKKNNEVCFSED